MAEPVAQDGSQRTSGAAMRLRLLGPFALRGADGAPVALPTRKTRLLLAYLAMPAGQAHGREKLAALFWGDRQEEQARGSLRQALSGIRAAIGEEALRQERDTVALVPGRLAVDAERLAEAAGATGPGDAWLPELFAGQFLEGFPSGSDEVAEWLRFERDRCRSLAQALAERLAERQAGEGRFAEAIATAERLLALDPLREQSHRVLMRLSLAAGERSRAAVQFQACRDLLQRELGIRPSPETLALGRAVLEADEAPPMPPSTPPRPASAAADPVAARYAIAVLPFAGMAEDGFLAQGFADDLVTELSRLGDFAVIARQSSQQLPGAAATAAASAGALGVRFALAGSLRRAGGRIRVTVQLVDAAGDRCIWAERYDRDLTDLFAVQDEIVRRIVGSVDAEIRQEERERVSRALPDSLDAWELFHRGLWHVYRFTREEAAAGEAAFRRAVAMSPDFALPYAGLGYAAYVKVMWYFAADPRAAVVEGIGWASRAVALDAASAFAQVVLGRLLAMAGDHAQALRHLTRAIELNPSFAQGHLGLAQAHFFAGRPQAALDHIHAALELSPKDPLISMFLTMRSFCHYGLGDLDAAAEDAQRACRLQARETWSRLALTVVLVAQGRLDEARLAVGEARRIEPGLSLETFGRLIAHAHGDLRDRVMEDLATAWNGQDGGGALPPPQSGQTM